MSADQSVTNWIQQLQHGDDRAAQQLWQFYFQNMVSLARHRLLGARTRMADEEDVAISAFRSFCMGVRAGKFDAVTDRDNLWPLLVSITAHKAVDLIRSENRVKRGGTGKAADEPGQRAQQVQLDAIFSSEPTPEFAAQIAEEFNRLLDELNSADDPRLHEVALLKMEGFKNPEIAVKLDCTRRTVERKLRMIASIWKRGADA